MAVRWQYRNDDFKFVDFTKKDSATLEKAWASNAGHVNLDIKGHPYKIDLLLFVQENVTTKTQRLIRRVDAVAKTGGKNVWGRGPVWEWESHHGVFTPYDVEANDIIEEAFMKDALRVHVKLDVSAHAKKEFIVHFGHMHQESADGAGVRKVRRVIRDMAPAAPVAAAGASEEADDKTARQKALETKKRAREESESTASASAKPTAHPRVETVSASLVGSTVLPSVSQWVKNGTVLALPLVASPGSPKVIKIAGFDMDDTLVFPKSGAVFAKSRSDWQWLHPSVVPKLKELHGEGYRVVIFSNQSGIGNKGWDETKANDIKHKIIDLSASCNVPIAAVIATKEDEFRKPCTAMWEQVFPSVCCLHGEVVDKANSFYCGDAAGRHIATLAGRKKDFSCSDRKFAHNLQVQFYTPEELFTRAKAAPFEWDGLGPADLAAVATKYPKASYHSTVQELVIFVGFPGCGKSTFYQRFFAPHGYMHVNRDTLKTPEKCLSATSTFLSQKKSVVVDNTNPSATDRAQYVALAKKAGVPARCFVFLHNATLANHMNILRARLGLCARVSSIAYNMFKSKYETVDGAKEGFAEVLQIDPVADFTGLPEAAKKLFYELS